MDSEDLPLSPWPQDMQINVEECWSPLTFLLFVRSAWHLEIDSVPRLDSEPDPGTSRRPADLDVDAAVQRWLAEWRRAWTHFDVAEPTVSIPDEEIQRLLDTLTDAELWAATSTSTWPSDFWNSGIDQEAYGMWRTTMPAPLGALPENRVIPALVTAGQGGLTTIIQLPYLGFFAQRINREHLVVSRTTRNDPEMLTLALALEA
ncbi:MULTISPECIES: hypothetical protein [Cryobacterium]|uniref:Uncharacterized protein n=1 Tax=Cryobacterium glucosi TaxID=1259175 RepID=A0ABY2IKZ2_9MICO|nr:MULTISPECIES: hypothetical protein [Cryobacterium]TFC00032.1 hypothetical protein E3O39_02495 [Cryobacterium sp. MDB2-A-1]TFC09304.1 hypothetical protein E3O35_14575 [Cryobacterium sp. MDB2-A-2]TFC16695.1 hypothetical protein E3O46_17420 [Cryobacterium glucosi]TFC17695.1 hypothetical protein E3O51_09355 [Cryobacterium sp. MDB2-10]TFC35610.1 hypothetical protein E3O55_01255 [Cryobacterium sp. MDB1-18-2]